MLLNYKKPVVVSSTLGTYYANNAVDENIKTYWSAATANSGEYLQSDLGNLSTVNAIQINYADQDVDSSFLGKSLGTYHRYKLYYSMDAKKWTVLADKSNNKTDSPHDYIELENLCRHVISGWKIFICPPVNLPSAACVYLAMAMAPNRKR
jgi:hypothetical protein